MVDSKPLKVQVSSDYLVHSQKQLGCNLPSVPFCKDITLL